MQYRPLGNSDMNVSVIAFGAWQLGDTNYWGEDAETDADAVVRTAIDSGINLFDTAEMYGDGASERALGQALGSRRDEVFIASKVWPDNCAPDKLRASCEASLKNLGTDCLDLYQVHWPCRDVPFAETFGAMARLRDEGKIRYIGVSNFGKVDLEEWLTGGEAVSDQIGYNMIFRAPEYKVIPACKHAGVGVLAYMPLMQGLLAGRYENIEDIPPPRRRSRHFSKDRDGAMHNEAGCEALLLETLRELKIFAGRMQVSLAALTLAWLLAQPGVTSAILGARKPAQLERNLAAANVRIDPAAMAELNEITGMLKFNLGANPDMWRTGDEIRVR